MDNLMYEAYDDLNSLKVHVLNDDYLAALGVILNVKTLLHQIADLAGLDTEYMDVEG